ncbi:MAG: FlgO family outer membrane protein [Desulfovibrionaceae bacterium]|nr:FlgO family outer membrane protein [Desulfovibrionaceae bacterium]
MLKVMVMDRAELKKRAVLGFLCLLGIMITACSLGGEGRLAPSALADPLPHAVAVDPPSGASLLNANITAGDALAAILLPRMGSGAGVLTTSLVELDDFEQTSAFGRLSAQQIGSRLSQQGFKVLEARLSGSLRFEKKGGEFMLTRDSLLLLANSYDAHAVLVGAYAESRDKIFISTRVVRLHDGALLAAYEYYLPKNNDAQALLGSGRQQNPAMNNDEVWQRYARREQAFIRPPTR